MAAFANAEVPDEVPNAPVPPPKAPNPPLVVGAGVPKELVPDAGAPNEPVVVLAVTGAPNALGVSFTGVGGTTSIPPSTSDVGGASKTLVGLDTAPNPVDEGFANDAKPPEPELANDEKPPPALADDAVGGGGTGELKAAGFPKEDCPNVEG